MKPSAAAVAAAAMVTSTVWYAYERAHRRTFAMRGGLHSEIMLEHAREFELYHNAFSLCSKKVRVCLAELGIPYLSHEIDLIETGSYETLGRRFLRVNPEGVLPVLVHAGHPVYQSHEQILYAAAQAPNGASKLVPSDPARRRQMQSWLDRTSLVGDEVIATTQSSAAACAAGLTIPLFCAMMPEVAVRRILVGLLFHRLRIRPAMFLVLKAAGIARFGLLSPLVRIVHLSLRHMHDHLSALEAHMSADGGPWIVGDTFTLADIGWMVIFARMAEQDTLDVFLDGRKYRAIAAYWRRLRDRPSYRAGIEAYRHPHVVRGTARLRAAKEADPRLRFLLEGPTSPPAA